MPAEVCVQVESKVRRAIAEGKLWSPGETIVVAVSGGPDSLCLLHVLRVLQRDHGGHLHLAHLDHGFRGPAAAAEAARVAALAEEWGLPATVEAEDVPTLMEREHLSAEEAARRARYRFLARVALQAGAVAVALGHTADDQAETVLMHLLRGAGLAGLRGMRVLARPAPWMVEGLVLAQPLRLVRPLLHITRQETVAYCAACGLTPAEDAWNQDPRFLRVRLRQEVFPLLETINPRFREALLRLSQLAAWQEDDLQEMLEACWPALVEERRGALLLNLERWEHLSWTLRLLALRRAVEEVLGHTEGLGWEAVVAAGHLDGAIVGSEVSLVEDVAARREYRALAIGRRNVLERLGPEWPDLGAGRASLRLPGRTMLPGGHAVVAEFYPREEDRWAAAGRLEAWVDADRVGGKLWLRHRRPGDRFQPLGMDGRKKLQDFFVDEKVPRSERERVPLILSPRGIVWVVGYRPDERFRVSGETNRVLYLRWELPGEQG